MTEAQLLAAVRELCAWLRILVYHPYRSDRSEPGFPDLVIAGPGGILFVELKSAKGRLTADQNRWIAGLTAAGATVHVWRPDDWHTGRIRPALTAVAGR